MSARQSCQTHRLNGINVYDLLALIDRVIREPAKGKTGWHVTTTWAGPSTEPRRGREL